MNKKKLILATICFLFYFSIAVLAYRPSAEGHTCRSNLYIIMSAIEMYNMDMIDNKITVFNEDSLKKLLAGHYLKSEPSKSRQQCEYLTLGDLSEGGILYCKYHGDANHILESEYYSFEEYPKLPQNTTIQDYHENIERISQARTQYLEKIKKEKEKRKFEMDLTLYLLYACVIYLIYLTIKLFIKK